jgi:hypothetical protein
MLTLISFHKFPANCTSDQANFINFCQGKTLTNGLQVKEGSCNGIGKYLLIKPAQEDSR